MAEKISKDFQLNLSVGDKGFSSGIAKQAKGAEKLAAGIEKVEKGASKAFGKKIPQAASASTKSFGELSKSAQTLRDRIEKAGKTQTAKAFNKLDAEAKKLQRDIRKLGKTAPASLKKIKVGATSARPSILSLRGAVGGLQSKIIGLGSIAAVGFAFKEVVGGALELEKATAEVSTIVDTAKVNVSALTAEVRSMAATFGIDGVEATKALYQTISAGVEPAQALMVLEQSAVLATAGIAGLEESVDLVTSVLNAYGLEASKAAAVTDSVFQTVEDGKVQISQLAASLGKVAPLAANAGVSLIELNAGVATLTASGLSVSEAVTGVQQVIKAFVKPTNEAAEAAAKVGFEMSASALATDGLEVTMQKLHDAMESANLRGEDTTEVMAKLFGRVEGTNAALIITGKSFDKFNKTVDNGKNALGAADKAAEKMRGTVGVKLKAAYQTVKEEALKFGNQILSNIDGFIDFIGGTDGVMRALSAMGAGFKIQFKIIGGLAKFLWGIIQSVADVFVGLGKIVWNNVQVVIKAVKAAKAAFSGDFNAALEHGSDIAGLIANNFDVAKDAFGKAGTNLGKAFSGAFSDSVDVALLVADEVVNVVNLVDGLGRQTIAGGSSGRRNSTEKDLALDRQRVIDRARIQDAINTQKHFDKIRKIEDDEFQSQVDARKSNSQLLLDDESSYQNSQRSIIRRGALSSRAVLASSLSSAFRSGINDAAPAFRSALSKTLSASAQPGVSFRGSSLQAGQGTRQQLRDSLFNREATGRQIATNIQLLASGFATGGTVPGADMGRDSMLVPLRGQEEVIRPEAARSNRGLLKMINASRGPVVMPGRSENLSFPGQASGGSGSTFSNSNSSSVNNSKTVTDNRQMVNIRAVNVQGGQASADQIANAVIKQIEYKARRGLLNMRTS